MRRKIATLLVVFLCAAFCMAQQSKYKPLPPFEMPADVDVRKADIYSEGTRMSAEVFTTKANAGQKLPVILMAHGWGGVAASLRREAVDFAKAGYFVVTFDYRGWGRSDSRVILTGRPRPRNRTIASRLKSRNCAKS
jgi:pimeloyl-ACP methyl ester carboxylesterase